jgi:hypothetical protein
VILLYLMHGPGRCNVPGICEDSAVNLADRLGEPVEEVRAALTRMSEDPFVLQVDTEQRVLRCPLAARMDPYRGAKTLRGWHKNWSHLPNSPLKYDHIESLKEKLDAANPEQVRVWNATFGAEDGRRFAVDAPEPVQQSFDDLSQPGEPPRPGARHQPRHHDLVAESEEHLPGRESVEHIGAQEYVDKYAADLLTAGTARSLGANADAFAQAMKQMIKKCPAQKRAAEWDYTACNYIETEVFIQTQGHTRNANNRSGRGGTGRASKPRDRSDQAHHSEGGWGAVVREKAARTAAAVDT